MRASRTILAGLLAAATLGSLGPRPALADGAASTRNIIFGAAAIGGTLLILNHNKKVHERYAEDARKQAALEDQRNNAEAAYEAEKQAYAHEVAINQEYAKEVSYQHQQVVAQERQLAQLRHSLTVAKAGSAAQNTAFVKTVTAPARNDGAQTGGNRMGMAAPQTVAYGWGTL